MLYNHVCIAGKINCCVVSHCYLLQLTLPDDIQSTRRGHSVTAISLAPGFTEVTMFGGSSSLYSVDCLAATTIITFGELNLCPHRMDNWRWVFGVS